MFSFCLPIFEGGFVMSGSELKAIETVYNGYRFRSRLEARWAVFFDQLGVRYQYEPEGFELPGAGRYLPDFWLESVGMWAEVKAKTFSEGETAKVTALALFHRKPVLMLVGPPELHPYSAYVPDLNSDAVTRQEFILTDGFLFDEQRFYQHRGEWDVRVGAIWKYSPETGQAYTAARAARFEFGESGPPVVKRVIPSTSVYLAGGISKGDWRQQIFEGMRDFNPYYPYSQPPSKVLEPTEHDRNDLTRDGFECVGPFFIGDDHGHFHGEGSHGLGAGGRPACGYGAHREQVVKWCEQWIQRSDVVFCWLDRSDTYGTFVELGWAHAWGKPVFLAYAAKFDDPGEYPHPGHCTHSGGTEPCGIKGFWADTWFARELAEKTIFASTASDAWVQFVAWRRQRRNP